MRSVTVDDVMSWEPCGPYTTERVTSLFAGRARVTALDVCAMDIPVKDILWAVLRKNMVEERVLHLFACWCAEQALIAEREAGREPDPASWVAVEVKRRWVDGAASDEELVAARIAAWKAVRVRSAAARTASWAAARDADRVADWAATRAATRAVVCSISRAAVGAVSRDTSRDADWAATRAAARNAALAAAWDIAMDRVMDRQLLRLVEMLEEAPR